MKELVLPEGIKVLESPDAVVVQLKLPGIEPVAAVVAEPGAGPEVIKPEKKKGDEDAEDTKK